MYLKVKYCEVNKNNNLHIAIGTNNLRILQKSAFTGILFLLQLTYDGYYCSQKSHHIHVVNRRACNAECLYA
jgi:hypothetical protein